MSAEASKRWADHGDDSDDEEILTLVPSSSQDVPIDNTVAATGSLSSNGKIVLGSSGTRAAARPQRDQHATRLVVANLEPEISESQVSRFLGPGDFSVRVARGRGLAFVEVRGAKTLVDRLLALDGTRLGRKVVSVRLDLQPKQGRGLQTAASAHKQRPSETATLGSTPSERTAVLASERWAFVETEKRERPAKPPKAERKASEAASEAAPVEGEEAAEGEEKPKEQATPKVVFVVEENAERKPLQLLPRTVGPKEIVVVAAEEAEPAVAGAAVAGTGAGAGAGGDKHTERLVRRKEAKMAEAAQAASQAKNAAKTKNRFAGLVSDDDEDDE